MTDERICIVCGCTESEAQLAGAAPSLWADTWDEGRPIGICTACNALPRTGELCLYPDEFAELAEMRRLQRELADDVARADVESFGQFHRGNGKDAAAQFRDGWLSKPPSTDREGATDAEWFDRAVRYLGLRGLIERHPHNPNLIRIKKEATK